jgi:dihydrofolate reductase
MNVTFDISASLDGFVAGPDPSPDAPLGQGGEQLHEWVLAVASWRRSHGQAGGETGLDDDLLAARIAGAGAHVMGKRMFCGEDGPWADPAPTGWWGDEPPFRVPVFVLTHHPREPLTFANGTSFHFVTEGIEGAVAQAREAAGEQDVALAGGGSVISQALAANLVDHFTVHVAPVFLGSGARLFDAVPAGRLEAAGQAMSPRGVAHLSYRVVR